MTELLEKELVFKIVGCAMRVHTALGCGLREKTYERALCLDFKANGVAYVQQPAHPVFYLDEQVDEYIPDIEAEERVIVEAKAIAEITDLERSQVISYLRVTGMKVGVLINFARPSLQWERIVLDDAR